MRLSWLRPQGHQRRIAGHIFGPMARTYACAIGGGLIAIFTVTPALCRGAAHGGISPGVATARVALEPGDRRRTLNQGLRHAGENGRDLCQEPDKVPFVSGAWIWLKH